MSPDQRPRDGDRSPVHGPCGVFVGLATLDVVHVVTARPGPNEKVSAQAQFVAAGGPAANAAVTFARLGGWALLVTALGSGAIAELIRADLAANRVHVLDAATDPATDVPVSAVTVEAGTGLRSVVGGERIPVPVAVPSDLAGRVGRAQVVLVDGHYPELALAAATAGRAAGVPVVLDAGRWKPTMADLLPTASAVVCSADFRMPGCRDSAATAEMLVAGGCPLVVSTHGSDPIRWWESGVAAEVPVPTVVAVDTSGAGDAFHGAYAYYLGDATLSTSERLTRAAGVAALRCAVLGPRDWLDRLPGIP